MAIVKSITLENGLVLEQAYFRIQGLNGNKSLVQISIEVFASKQLCEEGKIPVSQMLYVFTPSSDENSCRWDKQGYEHLKTLPEFSGALDV